MASSLESVNRSLSSDGKIAAKMRVKRHELDDKTLTIAASVSDNASW